MFEEIFQQKKVVPERLLAYGFEAVGDTFRYTTLIMNGDFRLTVTELLPRPEIYPAWHMNKKSWFTVILDGSVENEELFAHLVESYRLAERPPRKPHPASRKKEGVRNT